MMRRAFKMKKTTVYLLVSLCLTVIFVLSVIGAVFSNTAFRNSQVKNNDYSVVEATVVNITNLGKPVGAKAGTSSTKYRVELLYENEQYEITTTDIDFISQCEDHQKMNLPVTAYDCEGQLYASENDSTRKSAYSGYLFSLGLAAVSLIAMAMSWGAYYDLRKKSIDQA
jgi:hypothetical protein